MGKETVLALLLREKGHFVSGEAVSAELGITRAAIWKSISALRAQGYEIDAVTGRALIHSEKLSRNKPVSQKELEADALSIMIQANYGLELTEARKMHFKNHYDSFIETLKGTDKDPFTEIDSIFKSVFHSYKEHIESINDYVFNRINLNIENHHSLQQNLNDKSLHIKQSKHQKISIDR